MVGTGSTTKVVKTSDKIAQMMAKMGHKEGQGLGKAEDGMKAPIQISRREEGVGLGNENNAPKDTFKWNDSFWTDTYNQNAKKFQGITGEGVKIAESSSSSSSSDSSDEEQTKKANELSSDSDFSLEIIKEKVSHFNRKSKGIDKKDKKSKKTKK